MGFDDDVRDRIIGGMLGLVVGDALGVPVEFQSRDSLRKNPVADMRGYGSHRQPPGTWSDDSSMALVTAECLLNGYDPNAIMEGFRRWYEEAWWTPYGEVFDCGGATSKAILNFVIYSNDPSVRIPDEWGGRDAYSNGNGSLMRILPLSLYVHRMEPAKIIARSFEVSGLTHAHIRSKLCCAYYSLVVKAILEGELLQDAMKFAAQHIAPGVPPDEKAIFADILSGAILDKPEREIWGDGYVVHTLEASLWCCHRHGNFESAVLAAVNLGDDTDTTGAVTGALAGLIHNEKTIPRKWIDALSRREDVLGLIAKFASCNPI